MHCDRHDTYPPPPDTVYGVGITFVHMLYFDLLVELYTLVISK